MMNLSSASRRLAAAIALLGPLAAFAQISGFTGVFAPENWVFTSGGEPATVSWNSDYTAFTIHGSDDDSGVGSLSAFTLSLPAYYQVTFDWSFSTSDLPGWESGGYLIGSDAYDLTQASATTESGSITDPLILGSGSAGFYVHSRDNTFGPGTLTISNFGFLQASAAGTTRWQRSTPGSWTRAANWSAAVPDSARAAEITGGANVSLAAPAEAFSVYVESSTLQISGGGALTLANPNGFFAADYGAVIDLSGAGTRLETGGYLTLYTATAFISDQARLVTHGATLSAFDDNISTVYLSQNAHWDAGDLAVAYRGVAAIKIDPGARLIAGSVVLGAGHAAQGIIKVSGTGAALETGTFAIGDNGSGSLTVSQGARVSSQSVRIAFFNPTDAGLCTGEATISDPGSSWEITGDLRIGAYQGADRYATGSLAIVDGATVRVGTATLAPVYVAASGSIRIGAGGAAGVLQAASVNFTGISGEPASLSFNHSDDIAFLADVTGHGKIIKEGPGALTLDGANTYDGGTEVRAGVVVAGNVSAFGTGTVVIGSGATLDLAGFAITNVLDNRGGALAGLGAYSGSQTVSGASTFGGTVGGAVTVGSGGHVDTTGAIFTGPVTVESGGTISGTGTLASVAIASGGTLSPGDSPGLLTVDGDLGLAPGSMTLIEISGRSRGADPGYDAVNVSGALSLGGTLSVSFLDGFAPSGSATFDLFRFGSIGGSFAQINLPSVGGYVWDSSMLAIDGTLSLSALSSVPEPGSFALLASLASLGACAHRRRRPVRC